MNRTSQPYDPRAAKRTKAEPTYKPQGIKLQRKGKRYERCDGPEDVAEAVLDFIPGLDREAVVTITLNAKNEIIAIRLTHLGTLNMSVFSIQTIMRDVLLDNAMAFIVSHNHPSGDPEPSAEDISCTAKLVAASNLMGIKCLDHVIVGDASTRRFYSLNRHKLM